MAKLRNTGVQGLQVAPELHAQLQATHNIQQLPGIYRNLADFISTFQDRHQELLEARTARQVAINREFSKIRATEYSSPDARQDAVQYALARQDTNYIDPGRQPERLPGNPHLPREFSMAGGQGIGPADARRMVLHGTERWVPLENSIGRSNIIPEGENVVSYRNRFLSNVFKWEGDVTFNQIARIAHEDVDGKKQLFAVTADGKKVGLVNKEEFVGFNENGVILKHNGVHTQLILDDKGRIQQTVLEGNLTYILDMEDSSEPDKATFLRSIANLTGLFNGTLQDEKGGRVLRIAGDIQYTDVHGNQQELSSRTVPMVRISGMQVEGDENLLTFNGKAVPAKLVEYFFAALAGAQHIVHPKLHGPEEVALVNEQKAFLEKKLGVKLNNALMNEEARFNGWLVEALRTGNPEFINTGFLDYTASVMDLGSSLGAFLPIRELKGHSYIQSYERHTVDVANTMGVDQVGAGMWAQLENFVGCLTSKVGQYIAGNNTWWTPGPNTSAVGAMATNLVDLPQIREAIVQNDYDSFRGAIAPMAMEALGKDGEKQVRATFEKMQEFRKPETDRFRQMFTFPVMEKGRQLTKKQIQDNLDYAVHGLLVYADPWVFDGVGCSARADRDNVLLMEDCATARIKTAFLRNWLQHGVISEEQLRSSIQRMSQLVDEQYAEHGVVRPKKLVNDALQEGHFDQATAPVQAVHNLVFNTQGRTDTYVQPYFVPERAKVIAQEPSKKDSFAADAVERRAKADGIHANL